jgi:hypothetical protein
VIVFRPSWAVNDSTPTVTVRRQLRRLTFFLLGATHLRPISPPAATRRVHGDVDPVDGLFLAAAELPACDVLNGGGPPILLHAGVPTTAFAGQPVAFSAGFVDLWAGLGGGQPMWSFGDGSPAVAGAAATHASGAPGTDTVTLAASDALGNATSSTYTITVTKAPAGLAPPTITGFKQSHRVWRSGNVVARLSTSHHKQKIPVGTAFSFSLNEQATVTLCFTQDQTVPNRSRC